MPYAVNLADTTQPQARLAVEILLKPVLSELETVRVDGNRFDGVAVLLDCPDDQAEAIIDIFYAKFHDRYVRFYQHTGQRWKSYRKGGNV
jgi:hypothetical protein